jgi:hypothetical protein
VNIASTTPDPWQPGGPWDAQANVLRMLTDGRHEIGLAATHSQVYLPEASSIGRLGKQARAFDDQIVEMQRTVAKPEEYRFVVKKLELADKKEK